MKSMATSTHPTIFGPDPLALDGRQGSRYWVHHPYGFTGNQVVDERLSGYPVAVFQPAERPAHETPIVMGLQGMAAPYQSNGFLVSTLLDMGIACVLFDTPLAGERSLARNYQADIVSELIPFLGHNLRFRSSFVPLLMDVVARDMQTVLDLVRERHGLHDHRVALFGVSLGTLLTAYAFMKEGIGTRLLGTIGHADLPAFARSYSPSLVRWVPALPGRLLGKLAGLYYGPAVPAGIDLLVMLREVGSGGSCCAMANPMSFLDRVGPGRRIRFLVGDEDAIVRVKDARRCAARFSDGECYVVPGLGHGSSRFGPSFVEHVRHFLGTQLGDWR